MMTGGMTLGMTWGTAAVLITLVLIGAAAVLWLWDNK